MERMNALGEIVRSSVPYPVDYMQWAASNKMVISVKEVPGKLLYFVKQLVLALSNTNFFVLC
jgi:hypothetical protein